MNIDYSNRTHESPFADDAPENKTPHSANLPLPESPSPIIPPPKNYVADGGSEKAQFRIFIGAFFLIAAFPAGYWANYIFKEYQNNAAVLERWRAHPEEIRTTLKPADQIYIQSTIVQNKLLEASLSGAGSLLCFIIGAFLFARARKIFRRAAAKKLNYEPLDPQTILRPRNRIEVRATQFQNALLIGIIMFFGFLTVINLSHLFTSQFTTTTDIIYKGILLHGIIISLIFTLIFLMIRAKRKSVRAFDASGVTRGDGQQFSWNDFRGTETRTGISRFALIYVWRIELVFADGERAWLIPQRIKNGQEVFGFVNSLPAAVPKSAETN